MSRDLNAPPPVPATDVSPQRPPAEADGSTEPQAVPAWSSPFAAASVPLEGPLGADTDDDEAVVEDAGHIEVRNTLPQPVLIPY